MDQPLIPAGWEQILQVLIFLFVVVGFFRQFAPQRDIKQLSDRLDKLEAGQTDMKSELAALETRQDGFEKSLGELQRTANTALQVSRDTNVEVRVMQASILRLESYFETPKLKSS